MDTPRLCLLRGDSTLVHFVTVRKSFHPGEVIVLKVLTLCFQRPQGCLGYGRRYSDFTDSGDHKTTDLLYFTRINNFSRPFGVLNQSRTQVFKYSLVLLVTFEFTWLNGIHVYRQNNKPQFQWSACYCSTVLCKRTSDFLFLKQPIIRNVTRKSIKCC